MVKFLLYVILVFFVARAVWRLFEGVVTGVLDGGRDASADRRRVKAGVKMTRDPVCGTYVVPDRAVTTTRGGRTIYFCYEKCRSEYRQPS